MFYGCIFIFLQSDMPKTTSVTVSNELRDIPMSIDNPVYDATVADTAPLDPLASPVLAMSNPSYGKATIIFNTQR